MKNLSNNALQDEIHLGIDFLTILVDFWNQVGRQDRPNIDPKTHRKNNENKKASKMAKKSVSRSNPSVQRGSRALGRDPSFHGG